MIRALVLGVLVAACGQRAPRRIFQIRPLSSTDSVAIWSEPEGVRVELGRLPSSGAPAWALPLPPTFDTSDSRLIVAGDAATIVYRDPFGWVMGAYDIANGKHRWTVRVPEFTGRSAPILAAALSSVVIWNHLVVVVLDSQTGATRYRALLDRGTRPPVVTANYLIHESDGLLVAQQLPTGTNSRARFADEGCLDGESYFELSEGAIVAHPLSDLTRSVTVAKLDKDARTLRECGHHDSTNVFTTISTSRSNPGTYVLVADRDGHLLHEFAFDGDLGVHAAAEFRWRGVALLNGALPRYVPHASRSDADAPVELSVVDLEQYDVKRINFASDDDTLVFQAAGNWLVVPGNANHADVLSVDGGSGATSHREISSGKFPVVEPDDVADGVIWVADSSWARDKRFGLRRYLVRGLELAK